jgi:hypothetical protein
MHKSATKCNEIVDKWCKNKHGASKIIDTLETYQGPAGIYGFWMHTTDGVRLGYLHPGWLAAF